MRSSPKKFIKKSTSQIKEEIEKCLEDIAKDPNSCKPLTGKFKEVLKYPLQFNGVNYRIAFEIYEEEKLVGIIHIGTRENFYKELKRIY